MFCKCMEVFQRSWYTVLKVFESIWKVFKIFKERLGSLQKLLKIHWKIFVQSWEVFAKFVEACGIDR